MASVGVVGAGAAGLAAAYRLMRLGHDVTVYEASSRAGGAVRTERRDGFLAEYGPHSMQAPGGAVAQLLRDLDLNGRRVEANPSARKRYVLRNGRLRSLPLSPPGLLTSSLFSTRAKLALLAEPFAPRPSVAEESVAAFVRRRLGQEFLDYVADPFVSGTYAGDPEALSMRQALPRIHALEAAHGSVLRGAMRSARAGPPPATLMSFRDGLEELTTRLAKALGTRLRLGEAVDSVRREEPVWAVDGPGSRSRHDAVVLAAPAHALARIRLAASQGHRLAEAGEIPHPAVAVLIFGFHQADVRHPLDGFGMLIPAAEHRRILGAIFSSTVFPGRAPEGHVTLTVFMGGTRQPEVASLDPDTLREVALRELGELLGAGDVPVFYAATRWPLAIPQYVLGYERFLSAFDALESANPGLRFAGSYRHGVALGEALASGLDAADALHTRVGGRS
jgi:oxygen-dependent protoporphyrinogen oxidase